MPYLSSCPIQRKWLSLHPCEAAEQLASLTHTIYQLRISKDWNRAKLYLEWANEIAQILFDVNRHTMSNVPYQVTHISLSLADTLHKLGENEKALETLKLTEEKFESALENDVFRQIVVRQLHRCLSIIKKSTHILCVT